MFNAEIRTLEFLTAVIAMYRLLSTDFAAFTMQWMTMIKSIIRTRHSLRYKIKQVRLATPRHRSLCFCRTHNGRTAARWWLSLGRKSAFDLAMTLTYDLWPWKPLQQCPLTWWISTPCFIEIPPLEKSRHACEIGVNGPTDGQTDGRPDNIMLSAYCCWRTHNNE